MKKILIVLLSVLMGQIAGYSQNVSGKTVKELLMSHEWRVDNHIFAQKFVGDTIYYRLIPDPYVMDMPNIYYLSDVFVKEFDEKMVGESSGSKYLYSRGVKRESLFRIYEIKELTEEKLVVRLIYDSSDPDRTALIIGRRYTDQVYVPYND